MKRVLFVDDEPEILDGLRNLLHKQRRKWDMTFVLSGEAALEQLSRGEPFDVVVSDMRMPNMDGPELLRRVKELNPGAARIVLSGQADRELVRRTLPVAYQYLSKPVPVHVLRGVIERACELRSLLPDASLRKLANDLDNLPSVPSNYWELMSVLSLPDASLEELCEIMEGDPALHANVLQMANSDFFGGAQRATSISHAISSLGIALLKAIAMLNYVFSPAHILPVIEGFSLERLQEDALAVAAVAKQIVAAPEQANAAFAAALLRDVGQVVLALGRRLSFEEALKECSVSNRLLHIVEKEQLGGSHSEIGSFLLGTWGLPTTIVRAVAHHHDEAFACSGHEPVTRAIFVAGLLLDEARDVPGAHARLESLASPAELARGREVARKLNSALKRVVANR